MTRQRLANRRSSETFTFECNGLRYLATISRFNDDRLAEIFISNAKAGSHSDAAAKDAAVVCSIALQFGVPVDVFALRCRDLRDRIAAGRLGFIDAVDMAYSAAIWSGLVDDFGDDIVQQVMALAFGDVPPEQRAAG
jgi:hypothetical protein